MTKHKHTKACPECGGSGTLFFEKVHRQSSSNDIGYIEEYEEPCDNCGGDGEIEDDEYDEEEDEDERGDWLYHKLKDEELDHG